MTTVIHCCLSDAAGATNFYNACADEKGERVADAFCVSGNVQRRHKGRGAGAAAGPEEAWDAFLRVQPPGEILLP